MFGMITMKLLEIERINDFMNEMFKQHKIIPVVKIDDGKKAVPLAKALIAGGLPVVEITFRTECAEQAIKNITQECPEMLVGAGTILTIEQVDKAIKAGAKFIVSPGINPTVVKYCIQKNIPIIPGCITPSEIEMAIELGLKTVKFFPAEQAGGLEMIKAMSAPYRDISFMPTGGITLNNISKYLAFDKIVACGGSFMICEDLVEVEKLTRQAVKLVGGIQDV